MGTQPIQVLLVGNDSVEAKRLTRMLRAPGSGSFRLRHVRRLRDAQRLLQNGEIAVALVDLCLRDSRGLNFVREVQQTAPAVPLVLLSGVPDDALAAEALRQGAQDFLVKPELVDGLLARALHYAIVRQRAQTSLHFLSLIDELTGLHNRRGFVTLGEQHLKLTRRRGLRTSLVFVDLDDLKYINDSFGHREGDYALQGVARALRECFRDSDIIARLGGDEFCALLSDASESSEEIVRERLCRLLEAHNDVAQRPYRLSVSLGVVEVNGPVGLEHDIARADALMYAQKRGKQKQSRALSMAST
jgi:two-component system cell cycle response regulator